MLQLFKNADNDVYYGTDEQVVPTGGSFSPIVDSQTAARVTDAAPTTAEWELRATREGAAVVSGALAYVRPGVYRGTITKAQTAGLTLNATYYRVIKFVSAGRSDERNEEIQVVYRGQT